MYEKPLYPTPEGYRRSNKNPYKKNCLKNEVMAMLEQKAKLQKNNIPKSSDSKQLPSKSTLLPYAKNKGQMSEKAAKLIAQAIKSMLRSK